MWLAGIPLPLAAASLNAWWQAFNSDDPVPHVAEQRWDGGSQWFMTGDNRYYFDANWGGIALEA